MTDWWVLDPTRLFNLLLVQVPLLSLVGTWVAFFIKRRDARLTARHKLDLDAREAAEEAREQRRRDEAEEMRRDREAFYADILTEAKRSAESARQMRELYQAESDRAISLRTALAEAAHREWTLTQTVHDLTLKLDELNIQVGDLRRELETYRKEAA